MRTLLAEITLVVFCRSDDCIGSCKSNYHKIITTRVNENVVGRNNHGCVLQIRNFVMSFLDFEIHGEFCYKISLSLCPI